MQKSILFETQKKALEKAKLRYVQGDKKSLHLYLHRWSTWLHAVLPFKIHRVDEVLENIISSIVSCVNIPQNRAVLETLEVNG